ncbi:MAG: 1-deoxy-D-xylulose-5-phosphate reductoisomerase [Victivallales bacterium]|nr:1-deoxy-D-xylulose-5-phosphate reductoisomerase [Victivallales bacterium]
MKTIAILGSTGSIGTNTLKVVRALGDEYRVVGLAAGKNTTLLAQQAAEFTPEWVYAEDREGLRTQHLPAGCHQLADHEELCSAVCASNVDVVLCAIVGTAGLRPVLAAIEAGKRIALASKEILVMAGNLVTEAARRTHAKLLPVDSEHCAIFQCIDGKPHDDVRRIILTCSGGPFRDRKELDLSTVTLEQTLHHPTWNMGRKITIDSATLMNKGLEMIEAQWLFNQPSSNIEVVIHPQSIIHSMVEFQDGSVLAQMGYPDMCLPIHYCLTYPKRLPSTAINMDFTKPLTMTFEPPDLERFPALRIARQAMQCGGAAGSIFNAANEVAVQAFIEGRLTFDRIPAIVEETLNLLGPLPANTLDDILHADTLARAATRRGMEKRGLRTAQ